MSGVDLLERRRPLAGVIAAAGTFVLVAVPMFWTGVFALASFTGCFLECGEPDVGVGVAWAAATALLLTFPIAVGVIASRARLAWWWSPVLAAAIVATALLAMMNA